MNENTPVYKELKVLSLEDSLQDFEIISDYLDGIAENLEMTRSYLQQDFRLKLQTCRFDIILVDFNLPGFNAFRALEIARETCTETPLIVVSGAIGEETAIELLKQGAVDFVMKDKLERLPFAVERALKEAHEKIGHLKAQAELLHFHELMRYIIEHNRSAVAIFNNELKYIYVSQKYLTDYNILEKDIIGKHHYDLFPELSEEIRSAHVRSLAGEVLRKDEDPFYLKDGSLAWVSWECRPWYEADESIGGMVLYTEFITERKRSEMHAKLAGEILSLMNTTIPLAETITRTMDMIKENTGLEAIGIRLHKEEDFPFFCHRGFTDDFVAKENSILSFNEDGTVCRHIDGSPLHECTCGLIISGRVDPSSPCYTEGGSFWTNDSTVFLDLPPEKDLRFKPRNRCIYDGYCSIAIIPIKAEGTIIGLLMLNDTRKDRFKLNMIQFFESIGNIIGVGFMRKQAQEELGKSHQLLHKLAEQVPGVIYQYRLYPDGRSCFPYASSGLNMIYEVAPDEVREDATPVFDRLHPDDYQRVSDLIFESAREQRRFYCEFRVKLPEAGVRWRYCDALPELLDDGSTLWHGIIYDITKLKEAESDLTKRMDELERFHNLTVDRELFMIDLKKEVNELLKKTGQPEKYRIVG